MASIWSTTTVTTPRLRLRPAVPDDQEALMALFTDAEVRRFVGGPMDPESARETTKIRGERWGHFVICNGTAGAVVGSVSVAERNGRWELSYQLGKAFWGRGLAAEAVTATLGWFFDSTEAQSVVAITQAANNPSIRLLRRLGADVTAETIYKGLPQLEFTLRRRQFLHS